MTRLDLGDIDVARSLRGHAADAMRHRIALDPHWNRMANALDALLEPPPGVGRTRLAQLADHVLLSMVDSYRHHIEDVLERIDDRVVRILDDVERVRTGATPTGASLARSAEQRTRDLQDLAEALDEVRTFQQQMTRELGAADSPLGARLRNELEATLGFFPSADTRAPSGPYTPAAGETAGFRSAAEDLHSAIRRPRTGDPTVGRLLDDVQAQAARRLIDEAGGTDAAVRRILGGGTGPHENQMVLAVLVESGRITGMRRLPSRSGRGPNPDLPPRHAVAQEVDTGTPGEWTGVLSDGREVQLDGINEGLIVDTKWTDAPIERSSHLRSTGEHPSQRRAAESMLPVALEGAGREIDTGSMTSQMMRQAAYARENGLRGFQWRCGSPDLAWHYAMAFERMFRTESGGLDPHMAGLEISFTDLSGGAEVRIPAHGELAPPPGLAPEPSFVPDYGSDVDPGGVFGASPSDWEEGF